LNIASRHALMSKPREQRVDDALVQLVDLSLPTLGREPDQKADELFQRCCNRARGLIAAGDASSNAQDEDEVANLIRRKCKWASCLFAGEV